MILYSYFDQFKEETRAIYLEIKKLFYDNYSNPIMWIFILIIIVSVTMAVFNNLNKNK